MTQSELERTVEDEGRQPQPFGLSYLVGNDKSRENRCERLTSVISSSKMHPILDPVFETTDNREIRSECRSECSLLQGPRTSTENIVHTGRLISIDHDSGSDGRDEEIKGHKAGSSLQPLL